MHNDTSGNNRKNWEYFDAMNEVLSEKPEINAVATCSSNSGLNTSIEVPPDSGTKSSRKRKATSSEQKHREKMERQDSFLDCLQN